MDASLAAHAKQLLAGTGLTPGDAARIAGDPAAEVAADADAAAQAIRDGWAAARDGAAADRADPQPG